MNFTRYTHGNSHFYAPLEKGGILFCKLSVGRSVDQVLSAQYLLTPSLDQYQTWCRGCPQWVDDPYWFSGHMFKTICTSVSYEGKWWKPLPHPSIANFFHMCSHFYEKILIVSDYWLPVVFFVLPQELCLKKARSMTCCWLFSGSLWQALLKFCKQIEDKLIGIILISNHCSYCSFAYVQSPCCPMRARH